RAGRAPSEERLAPGAAPAGNLSVAVGVVVVGDLFAPPDLPRGANPDPAVRDVHVAVGPARMVDEACDVAADVGVDDGPPRQREAPDVGGLDIAPLAPQAFLVRDLLAPVVHDPRVLRDRLGGKHAPSVDRRVLFLDHPY